MFTSGATESNNIAIKGVAKFQRHTGKDHLITLQTVGSYSCCVLKESCAVAICSVMATSEIKLGLIAFY